MTEHDDRAGPLRGGCLRRDRGGLQRGRCCCGRRRRRGLGVAGTRRRYDTSAVNSAYLRGLANNPALEGHNFNFAKPGSTADDLPRQVEMAVAQVPLPDLFIIQGVDNDISCDGTDADNYEPFGTKMDAVVATISKGAPSAEIYVVGLWATVQNYTDVTQQTPTAVARTRAVGHVTCSTSRETSCRRSWRPSKT